MSFVIFHFSSFIFHFSFSTFFSNIIAELPSNDSATHNLQYETIGNKKDNDALKHKKQNYKENNDNEEDILINFNVDLHTNKLKKDNTAEKEYKDNYSMNNYYINYDNNNNNYEKNNYREESFGKDNNNFVFTDKKVENQNFMKNMEKKSNLSLNLKEIGLNIDPLTGTIMSDSFTIINIDDDNEDDNNNNSNNDNNNDNNSNNDNNDHNDVNDNNTDNSNSSNNHNIQK